MTTATTITATYESQKVEGKGGRETRKQKEEKE